ncbi:alpha-ketoglutarate-dependent dioxygenase AlkB family protein [Sediminibacterium sp.]|uniref:alpha-ketoglutarate-dependent dioxygenase AlkB family protein n=1 Tax=Sediminibacterium sp. TaxID=1917865 RepID=UPI003F705819
MIQSSLFSEDHKNLLPYDGFVQYFGGIYSVEERNYYLDSLLNNIEWENDQVKMFGKLIITRRKVAWYGSLPFEYRYSNTTKKALPFTSELIAIKQKIEAVSGETYNACLLNLYHNGSEGMGWHSDAEPELKKQGAIASLSLGAERKFVFKHKVSSEKRAIILESGSLLVMKGSTQDHWLHQLPASKKISELRVNLTFRTIKQ